MAYKCKPITSKAKEASKPSPNKYMANLVGDLKGMYQSKGYIDPAQAIGVGLERAKAVGDAFKK
jgi:hypothetical protein